MHVIVCCMCVHTFVHDMSLCPCTWQMLLKQYTHGSRLSCLQGGLQSHPLQATACTCPATFPRNQHCDLTPSAGLREEALFIYNESAACYWYNTTLRSSADAQRQYCMAGWLAGQALHNRTDLGIRLAPLLWQKVLQGGSFQVR